eukprot:scaffold38665_cov65-Phaeocystis_antarctica.AAC.1
MRARVAVREREGDEGEYPKEHTQVEQPRAPRAAVRPLAPQEGRRRRRRSRLDVEGEGHGCWHGCFAWVLCMGAGMSMCCGAARLCHGEEGERLGLCLRMDAAAHRLVDGWVDGWMGGWMGGWKDSRADGSMDLSQVPTGPCRGLDICATPAPSPRHAGSEGGAAAARAGAGRAAAPRSGCPARRRRPHRARWTPGRAARRARATRCTHARVGRQGCSRRQEGALL